MNSIRDLLSEEKVEKLASPANLRLGRELVKYVELLENDAEKIVAKVKGGDTRTVSLTADGNALSYSCTCLGKQHFFCKHCVAAAFAVFK